MDTQELGGGGLCRCSMNEVISSVLIVLKIGSSEE